MFGTQEAISFLQDDWGVQRVEERLKNTSSRKGLLDEIATLIQVRLPFQCITLMATPPDERKRPTVDSIKTDCKRGLGGLCFILNVFAWGLLRGLGFRARLSWASCTSTTMNPNNHIMVLIYDLDKKGDIHLVETGCGFPTFRAISLNFAEESPAYVDSYLEYKYIRHGGKYLRMHGKGDTVKRNDPPIEGLDFFAGKWRRFYYFSLEPTDKLSDFDAALDRIYTVPCSTPFDHFPRCLAFPDQRAVILVNNRLKVDKNGELETTVLDGDEAIVHSYRQYFSILGEDAVRRALYRFYSLSQLR
ncbi:hypothetical protein ACOMHN_004690 [Nucella lapillus]